jgi:hypothetical protein
MAALAPSFLARVNSAGDSKSFSRRINSALPPRIERRKVLAVGQHPDEHNKNRAISASCAKPAMPSKENISPLYSATHWSRAGSFAASTKNFIKIGSLRLFPQSVQISISDETCQSCAPKESARL